MSANERDCPICFRAYTWDRLQAKPSEGKCAHGFCEECGEAMAEAMLSTPFKCPMCRADITEWFVERFEWISPVLTRRAGIEQMKHVRALMNARDG